MPCEHGLGQQNTTLQPGTAELPKPELLHSPWIHLAWPQINSKCHNPAPCEKVHCYAHIELAGWQYQWVLILIQQNIPFSLKHWWLSRPLFSLICHHSKLKNPNLFKISPNRRYFTVLTFSFSTYWTHVWSKYAWCTKYECKKNFSTRDLHTIPVFNHRNYDHQSLIHPLHLMFSWQQFTSY